MGIAEILALAGVAEPLIADVVRLFEQMIAGGSTTTTQEQTDALTAAVAAAQEARQAYEDAT